MNLRPTSYTLPIEIAPRLGDEGSLQINVDITTSNTNMSGCPEWIASLNGMFIASGESPLTAKNKAVTALRKIADELDRAQ